jgi:hypothetical protein
VEALTAQVEALAAKTGASALAAFAAALASAAYEAEAEAAISCISSANFTARPALLKSSSRSQVADPIARSMYGSKICRSESIRKSLIQIAIGRTTTQTQVD